MIDFFSTSPPVCAPSYILDPRHTSLLSTDSPPTITGSPFLYGHRAMTVDLPQKPMPPDRRASADDPLPEDQRKSASTMPSATLRPGAGVPSPNSSAPSSFLIRDILSGAASGDQQKPGGGFSPPVGSSPPMPPGPHPLLHPLGPPPPPHFFRPLDIRRPNGGHFSPPLEDEDGGNSSDEDGSRDVGNGKSHLCLLLM